MSSLKQKILFWGQKRIEKGAPFFAPISWGWGVVSFCKNFAYDQGIFSQTKVGCLVVSIGNIVAGGTGKTPLTLLLASKFQKRRIAILTRGYGEVPDEALLFKRRLKNGKVYIGKDRLTLAKRAVEEGAELIFLDDGFQYRKLFRDFDVVTLSGEDPFGKGHYLPQGLLRDSPRRLKKADALFVLGDLKFNISLPFTSLHTKIDRVLDVFTDDEQEIRGKKVAIFSGIAKPERFRSTVESLAIVLSEKILLDHEKITERSLKQFCDQAKGLGAEFVLCTEKDAVKIPEGEFSLPISYLQVSSIGSVENLVAKINQKLDNLPL